MEDESEEFFIQTPHPDETRGQELSASHYTGLEYSDSSQSYLILKWKLFIETFFLVQIVALIRKSGLDVTISVNLSFVSVSDVALSRCLICEKCMQSFECRDDACSDRTILRQFRVALVGIFHCQALPVLAVSTTASSVW